MIFGTIKNGGSGEFAYRQKIPAANRFCHIETEKMRRLPDRSQRIEAIWQRLTMKKTIIHDKTVDGGKT